ncbi:hypothetical protein L2E82_49754 [Cichorium intybus]|uniref:Uncharacterized protein n=1 Tax=Cichorium intybus TaxID=13427 RepID=A0ACB8Z289_CICIN|nr:hypothetical protein L2E82_49754 [Cichorium intybus]
MPIILQSALVSNLYFISQKVQWEFNFFLLTVFDGSIFLLLPLMDSPWAERDPLRTPLNWRIRLKIAVGVAAGLLTDVGLLGSGSDQVNHQAGFENLSQTDIKFCSTNDMKQTSSYSRLQVQE